MIEEILEKIKDKKICILGFGVEGKSTYEFIRKHFKQSYLEIRYQNKTGEEETYLEKDNNIKFLIGDNYLENLEQYDYIFKSPGISLKNIDTDVLQGKILTQLELFLKYCNCYTIGITGTKGKSTTSSLIYSILKEQEKDVYLLGNIGTPLFNLMEEIKKDSYVVIEMSSHALEFTKASSNIAILLNIYEEHLDHYNSYDSYADAKFNIFKYQKKKDYAIFNIDNKKMNEKNYEYKKEDFGVSINNASESYTNNTIRLVDDKILLNDKELLDTKVEMNLKGEHNINNIMFALAVCEILKLDLSQATETIKTFKTLEHRLEFVGVFDGVEYYNDSIATIPEATISSIKALKNVNSIILGGNDRGVNLDELIDFLKETDIENIICLPQTGIYIAENLKQVNKKVIEVKDLKEAVDVAKKVTKKNTICLLSPAASSYGFFKNFEERGKLFKKYVKEN